MTRIPDFPERPLTIDALMHQARENERKWQRIVSAELRLMSSTNLQDCLSQITLSLPRRQGWDALCLTLVDEDYSLRRMLSGADDVVDVDPSVRFVETSGSLSTAFSVGRRPVMEKYRERRHKRVFGKLRLGSVCTLPLVRGTKLVGSLAVASRDPERFAAGNGAEFLSHLAAVVAISIEAVSARDQLRMISLTDPLTGVNNRRYFDRRMRDEVLRARRDAVPASLLFIDVDHFKTANDVGGHAYGDRVLQNIARAIGSEVRQSDVLCRYGGDEFACLLTGMTVKGACEIAERVRAAVAAVGERLAIDGCPATTVSIGVACVSEAEDTIESFLQRADDAVYAAKAAGRDQVIAVDHDGVVRDAGANDTLDTAQAG